MLRKLKKEKKKLWQKSYQRNCERSNGVRQLPCKNKDLRVWIFHNDKTNTLCGPKDFNGVESKHGVLI